MVSPLVAGLLLLGCGVSRPHQTATTQATPRRAVRSDAPASAERCTPTGIGFIGSVRPGESSAAAQALGGALLAHVNERAEGRLMIARTANGMSSAELSTYFSRWEPLLSQSRKPQFLSCDMRLRDRPAAKPIITAALTAVAGHGYSASASALRSELQEVLISGNPSQPATVIVTLMVPGAAYHPANAPVMHQLAAYTAVVNVSSDQVSAVARGGL